MMNQSIPSAQGLTLPIWLPIFGGIPINSPLVGSFLAIIVSVTIAMITIKRTGDSNSRHIKAVEKASTDQIKETRYWIDLKRKQLLKALVRELVINIGLYEFISYQVQNKIYTYRHDNINLIIMEKCLKDTPIDNERINADLITIYIMLKLSQNYIRLLGTSIQENDMKKINDKIVHIYESNKSYLERTLHDLEIYEKSIELHPPDGFDQKVQNPTETKNAETTTSEPPSFLG